MTNTPCFSALLLRRPAVSRSPERSKRQDVDARRGSSQRAGLGITEMLPDTTDWYGRSRPKADASNDYLLDREKCSEVQATLACRASSLRTRRSLRAWGRSITARRSTSARATS